MLTGKVQISNFVPNFWLKFKRLLNKCYGSSTSTYLSDLPLFLSEFIGLWIRFFLYVLQLLSFPVYLLVTFSTLARCFHAIFPRSCTYRDQKTRTMAVWTWEHTKDEKRNQKKIHIFTLLVHSIFQNIRHWPASDETLLAWIPRRGETFWKSKCCHGETNKCPFDASVHLSILLVENVHCFE